jgi:hypothetical protein
LVQSLAPSVQSAICALNVLSDARKMLLEHGVEQRLLMRELLIYMVPTDTPARSATRVVVSRWTPSDSKT